MNLETKKRLSTLAMLAAVLSLTAAVYLQVTGFGFIHLDDFDYVIENPHVKGGISWRGLRWAFTSFYACNWHPLTWISHMLDCEIFGLNPAGHHITNLIFHLTSTAMLFLLLRNATGSLFRSAFVAVVFGVHPLHVESVAWISERKDVLSTLFLMLSLWSYLGYARSGSRTNYALVLLFFAMGLMSKQMLVTLPIVLLLLDFWPLDRFATFSAAGLARNGIFPLLFEKIPFFLLALAGGSVAFIAQHTGGATASFEAIDFLTRLQNACLSYFIYIFKTVWPSGLGVFYPYPEKINSLNVLTYLILVLSMTFFVIYKSKRAPYAVTGWIWYLVTLLPVIGIVQIGAQAHADRYTYIPMIGLVIVAAWGGAQLAAKFNIPRTIQLAIVGGVVFALTVAGHRQASYWKDSITLFKHTISVTNNNWLAYNSLGSALKEAGKLEEAIESYKKSISIKPYYPEAHNNLGVALTSAGRRHEAELSFRKALSLKPDYAEALDNLGVVLAQQGKPAEAVDFIRKALNLRPFNAKANNNMGNVLSMLGLREDAIRYYNEALKIDPTHKGARQNMERLRKEMQGPVGSPFRQSAK